MLCFIVVEIVVEVFITVRCSFESLLQKDITKSMISISTPFKCRHLKMILVRRTHFSNDNGGEEFFLLPCHYIVALRGFKPPEEVLSFAI